MTYFHGGGPTIIGAVSFHGPVRDGKGWFQDAMVVRLQLVEFEVLSLELQRGRSVGLGDCLGECALVLQGYRIKPHGQLVSVSLTHYCASTPDLSTSWS